MNGEGLNPGDVAAFGAPGTSGSTGFGTTGGGLNPSDVAMFGRPGLPALQGFGQTPPGMGALRGILYGWMNMNPAKFTQSFQDAVRRGYSHSAAASYAAEASMPTPNANMVRFAQNTGLSSLLGGPATLASIPNPLSINSLMGLIGLPNVDVAAQIGLPTTPVSPTSPAGQPEGGEGSSIDLNKLFAPGRSINQITGELRSTYNVPTGIGLRRGLRTLRDQWGAQQTSGTRGVIESLPSTTSQTRNIRSAVGSARSGDISELLGLSDFHGAGIG